MHSFALVEVIMEKAGITKKAMDSEVLVGGSNWMALGEQTLHESFFSVS
jgi:hypothetical protein